ncbi:MAG: phosphatase PAP2 family protein [Marinicella sp.]|nr:phosphatase PAP2 family protein [Xanthomonadales bacterium]
MKALDVIQAADVSMVKKLFASRLHNSLIPLAKKCSSTGDGWMYLLAALIACFSFDEHRLYILSLLLGYAIERPAYYVLKNLLRRNRPFRVMDIKNSVDPSDQFSFPSGHTSAAFMFTGLTATAFPVLFIPLIIWAVLIGCSRVILGVHYPSDILVGAVLGMTLAHISLIFIN